MNPNRPVEYLRGLLKELLSLPRETEWVEYKLNNDNPLEIGEYISALSNSAALCGKAFAFLVWGITDDTREVAGTSFNPGAASVASRDISDPCLR